MRDLTQARLEQAIGEGDELWTIAEAADHLGVAPAAIRGWVRRDTIGSTVVNGARCVLASEVSFTERLIRQTQRQRGGRQLRDMWASGG